MNSRIIVRRRSACRRLIAGVCGGLALSVTVGASAEEKVSKPVSFAINLGANTDYVFRGVSQTDEDPSVFGSVDAAFGGVGYAGVWASKVDFGNGTDFEYDVYAGVRPRAGPVTLDLGVIRYGYAGSPSGSHQDYWEGKVGASIPAGPATLGATVYYSPDFFGGTGDAVYYEANAAMAVPRTRFTVSGALGRQEVKGPLDYTTWNAGVGYALTDHVGFDLRYFDTDEHRFGDIYDSRVVGGVKFTF